MITQIAHLIRSSGRISESELIARFPSLDERAIAEKLSTLINNCLIKREAGVLIWDAPLYLK